MKKVFTSIFFFLLLNSSCTYLITRIQGLKNAKPKSINHIKKFSERRKLGIVKLYTSRDSVNLRVLYSRAAKEFIFQSDGSSIDYNDNTDNPKCGKNVIDFIREFNKGSTYKNIENKSWSKEQNLWQDIDKQPVNIVPTGVYDLMIVYYWGTFVGRPNLRKRINQLKSIIASRPDLSIYFVLVNIDLRNDINYENESKILKPLLDKRKENRKDKQKVNGK
jgi:hypothetical protein